MDCHTGYYSLGRVGVVLRHGFSRASTFNQGSTRQESRLMLKFWHIKNSVLVEQGEFPGSIVYTVLL